MKNTDEANNKKNDEIINEENLLTQIKEELKVMIVPLLSIMIAVIMVFTIPIWNSHPGISFFILILFFLIVFSICVWRLFDYIKEKSISIKAKSTCIFAYSILLIIAIAILIAGILYLRNRTVVDFKEINTVMIVQHPSGDERSVPSRRIPYGRGGVINFLENGAYVYVFNQGVNSHGNIWYQTDSGWFFHEHLLEIPDEEKVQQLINDKLIQELKKRDVKIFNMTVGISLALLLTLLSCVLRILVKRKRQEKRQ